MRASVASEQYKQNIAPSKRFSKCHIMALLSPLASFPVSELKTQTQEKECKYGAFLGV
jgi:hypothetical protein